MNTKLGTIETGFWGKPDEATTSNEYAVGAKSPTVSVRCGLGRIVASACGDPGVYDDVYIDLVTDDGRCLQLAVVSCSELDGNDKPNPTITVYAFDGKGDSPVDDTAVHVADDSMWYSCAAV